MSRPPILIAEDEPFIALDLALAVENAGGLTVGPAGTVREALALLATSEVAAAILDVNLSDGDVFPVVQMLIDRGIPVIIQTGVATPASLSSRYPGITVLAKPVRSELLLAKVMALLSRESGDSQG